ncbi:phospholipase A2 inhibitor gamma subunit B isoform X2 [Chelonia mydas]|uniref:phospholipase A2 inhibitor gamma subunit B isoform X2 n=1 Tax=Chelonia mydas TaxID=8469 RepID=UPI001CA8581F|nr:phospholipase A2 inhibitor gamma subunit B isoform X2 [Chelonia mydas]
METSLVVCILAALLATGACLQCETCVDLGKSCTGNLETCAAGQDSCGIFLTEVTVEGERTQSFLKGCIPSSECNAGPLSMNFGKGMTARTSIACCVGDACRTTTVTAPPADPKPNGRRCRGCYVWNAAQCNEQTTECAGSETQCLDAAGTVTIGGSQIQTIMKGCVSESFCAQLQTGSGTIAGIGVDLITAKCTVASGAAGVTPRPAGLLLPALAGLLLLKLLS